MMIKIKTIFTYTLLSLLIGSRAFAQTGGTSSSKSASTSPVSTTASNGLIIPMIRTATPVRAVSWNKDGTTFAYAEEGNIIVRDSSGYKLLQSMQTGNGPIKFLQYTQSTAGQGLNQLVTLTDSNIMEFRILPQRDPIHVAKANTLPATTAFNLSYNGNNIGTATETGKITVHMQNYLTNVFISREISELQTPVYSLYFSRNNRLLITGSADDSACVWDVASGKLLNAMPYYSKTKVPVLITHDNNYFIMASSALSVGIYDVNYKKVRQINSKVEIQSMTLSADGSKVIILTKDNFFYFYDLKSGTIVNYIPAYNASKITSYAFNNVTTKAVVCHEDGCLYVLDIDKVLLAPTALPPPVKTQVAEEKTDYNLGEYQQGAEVPKTQPQTQSQSQTKQKQEQPKKEEKEKEERETAKRAGTFRTGHGIVINGTIGTAPKPYSMAWGLDLGYLNYFLIPPFYFGGFLRPYMAMDFGSYPYTYQSVETGENMPNPWLAGGKIYGTFGFTIQPWESEDLDVYADINAGMSAHMIWNGKIASKGITSKLYPCFYAGLKVGVGFKFLNLAFIGEYDVISGMTIGAEVGGTVNLPY